MRCLVAVAVLLGACDDSEVERKLEANERRVQELEQELAKTKRTVHQQGARVVTLEDGLAGLGTSAQTNAEQIEKLDGQVAGLETAVRTRQHELGFLRREVQSLARKVRDQEGQYVWDGADRFIGWVVEKGDEGVIFSIRGVPAAVFTELVATDQVGLYFTGANCTGTPVAVVEATGGMLGFFRQPTGEVLVPTGRFRRARVQSAALLVAEGGCLAADAVYEVEELEVAQVLDPYTPGVSIHTMD